jgi:hypothetical protein
MSTAEDDIDDEIEKLICLLGDEQADELNLPEGLLRDIYLKEKQMVTMDRRSGLPSDLRSILEKYVDEGWNPE